MAKLQQQAAELAKLQAEPELSYEAGPAFNGAAGGAAGGSATVHAPWGAAPEAAPEAAEVALEADAVDVDIHGIIDPNLGGGGDMWGEGALR